MKEFTYEELNNINLKENTDFTLTTLNTKVNVTIVDNDIALEFNNNEMEDIKKVYNYFVNKGYNIELLTTKFPNKGYHIRYVEANYDFLDKISPSTKILIKFSKEEYVNYEEYRTFIENIKWYKKIINEFNLSPAEKVLFAYDILKTYDYTKENKGEDQTISRTSYKVINSGKIVCVGYTEILNEILFDLDPNIRCGNFITNCDNRNEKRIIRHMRSMVRLDDPKYNIHGLYALDSTWDSGRTTDDYKYFLVPFYNYKKVFPRDTFPHFFVRDLNSLNKEFNSEDVKKLQERMKETDFEEQLILDDYVLNGVFEGIKTQKEKIDYFLCKPISFDTLINISVNVRKAQGYNEKEAWDSVANIAKTNTKYKDIKEASYEKGM